MRMKSLVRLVIAFIVMLLAFLFATNVQAKGTKVDGNKDKVQYADVGEDYWAKEAIEKATQLGLFGGYETEDGKCEFRPKNDMTKGHFVTVIARGLFPDKLEEMPKGERYFTNAYTLLIENGILKESEIKYEELDEPCKRQETALLLVRADMFMWPFSTVEESDFKSDELEENKEIDEIPDLFDTVDEHYRNYVLFCYTAGYLTGVNSTKAFHGQDTMNRAQGAVVLVRLVNEITSWEDTVAGIDSADKDGGEPDIIDEDGTTGWTGIMRTIRKLKTSVKDGIYTKIDRRVYLYQRKG